VAQEQQTQAAAVEVLDITEALAVLVDQVSALLPTRALSAELAEQSHHPAATLSTPSQHLVLTQLNLCRAQSTQTAV
jgi:hypothetical protein